MPDEWLGKFCIFAGCAMVTLAFFLPHFGERCSAASGGFIGLSWGLKQVAAAKKWRQKYGAPTVVEQMEIKKNHSISNLPLLLMLLVFGIGIVGLVLGFIFITFSHY